MDGRCGLPGYRSVPCRSAPACSICRYCHVHCLQHVQMAEEPATLRVALEREVEAMLELGAGRYDEQLGAVA